MNGEDRLVLAVAALTATSTFVAAIVGVMVASALEGWRRQRAAMQQVRQLLHEFYDAESAAKLVGWLEGDRRDEREHAEWRAKSALHEIELRIPDLPYRVREFIGGAVDVLHERHRVGLGNAVSVAIWESGRVLKEAHETRRLRWWFFRRWRKATMTAELRDMVEHVPDLHEQDREMHELEKRRRSEANDPASSRTQ